MTFFEIVIIALAMSFDIFAKIICESSSYAKLDKRKLGVYSLAFACGEILTLSFGYFTIQLIEMAKVSESGADIYQLLSVFIILGFAINMFLCFKNDKCILEHRNDEVSFAKLIKNNAYIGLRTFLIGIVFASCDTPFAEELFVLTFIALIMVFAGLYVGYRYGYGLRKKAYLAGAVLLAGTDLSLFYRFFVC